MNANCCLCGARFEARRKTARFCSDRCRIRFHRGEPVPLSSVWLREAAFALASTVFAPAGVHVNPGGFDVSFGFPLGMTRILGKVIDGLTYRYDDTVSILIPAQDAPLDVLAVLVHEMIHAHLPGGEKHGKGFRRVCKVIDLLPPYTSTMPGPVLQKKLKDVLDGIGPMPNRGATAKPMRAYVEQPDGSFVATKNPYVPFRREYKRRSRP